MKVWELFLILVPLAVAAMSCQLHIVDEPPAQIKALIGSSLTLGCSFITNCSSGRVDWCFTADGSSKATKVTSCTGNFSKAKSWCNHTLTDVQRTNTGSYMCDIIVEKPMYMKTTSNRTEVDVVPGPPGFTDVIQNQTFLIVSGTAGLLLVLLIIALTCFVRRRRRSHQDRMYPVYSNTRPQPSATRKQETVKPRTQEAAGTPLKGASCRTAPPPKHPCRDARRKSTPKT